MTDVVFMLRNPDPSAKERCAVGRTTLEQAVLDALVRRVVEHLDHDEHLFMMAHLWAPARGQPRTSGDTCSRLQRLGLVAPTRARSVCPPDRLTPIGHSVRRYIFDRIQGATP